MPRITDRPNYAARWTPAEFEQLVAELKAGRTVPEIAKAMGRSQEAIRTKAWQAGLLPSRRRKSSPKADLKAGSRDDAPD